MNLREFEGKNVRIIDTDGEEFEGFVGDYIYPEDNEPEGVACIIIDNPEYENPLGFNETEIEDIQVIP